MKIETQAFGTVHDQPVTRYVLTNDHGTEVSVLSWGATWHTFTVQEDGQAQPLLVSFPTAQDYAPTVYYLNQAIGRVAGRIAKASFTLNGTDYHVEANEGANSLHGGDHGFAFVNWAGSTEQTATTATVVLTHTFHPEDDQYPGTLTSQISYTLDDQDQVTVTFTGDSDAATLFNPTIHAYFNVTDDQESLDTQWLKLSGTRRLALDGEKLPTGKLLATAKTGYDFQQQRLVTDGLAQLKTDFGGVEYDDAFEVVPSADQPIAEVGESHGHRRIQLFSDRNGLVVFTANPTDAQKADQRAYNALAMEAQTLPDAIHHPEFGDITLAAHEPVTHTIRYQYQRQ